MDIEAILLFNRPCSSFYQPSFLLVFIFRDTFHMTRNNTRIWESKASQRTQQCSYSPSSSSCWEKSLCYIICYIIDPRMAEQLSPVCYCLRRMEKQQHTKNGRRTTPRQRHTSRWPLEKKIYKKGRKKSSNTILVVWESEEEKLTSLELPTHTENHGDFHLIIYF